MQLSNCILYLPFTWCSMWMHSIQNKGANLKWAETTEKESWKWWEERDGRELEETRRGGKEKEKEAGLGRHEGRIGMQKFLKGEKEKERERSIHADPRPGQYVCSLIPSFNQSCLFYHSIYILCLIELYSSVQKMLHEYA